MIELSEVTAAIESSDFEPVVVALAESGWGCFTNIMDSSLLEQLYARARNLETFRPAAIGRDGARMVNREVRGDEISWIDGQDPAERAWLRWSETLRTVLNRSLLLNLAEFESHFAHYAPGTGYQLHLDAFTGSPSRIISVVLYLNPHWSPDAGGELVVYNESGVELIRVLPLMGALVVFESARFPHQVLPARSHRFSIAGWYRGRPELPVNSTLA